MKSLNDLTNVSKYISKSSIISDSFFVNSIVSPFYKGLKPKPLACVYDKLLFDELDRVRSNLNTGFTKS
jgi:hypothetical protein